MSVRFTGGRGRSSLWLTALVSLLGACAPFTTAPPALPAAPQAPAAWSGVQPESSGPPAALQDWWQRFDDALLTRLVRQALQANRSVASAQGALRQARALRDVSAAGLWPTVDGSASVRRSRTGDSGAVNSFQVGLDASWELDLFGARHDALRASEAVADASAANLGDVQTSISAEVALAYIGLRGAQARLAIATESLASQLQTLQLTQWRVQAGLLSSLEDEQARAAAEQTRAQQPLLRTTILQGSHALAVLTGQPPAALLEALAPVRAVPQAGDAPGLAVPAEMLRQRPDVRAAELQVSAAMARVAQSRAQRLPDFRLGGSIGSSALTLGALTNGASVVAALLVSAAVPVFDGGAGSAQVRAQQAAMDQSVAAWHAAVLGALKEVEDALAALQGDRERVQHLELAATAADNAALMARQRFESGVVDFQTVLDTQRTRLGTQDALASATADVSTDQVRLFKALGGGWQ